ncbi:MAG: dephospho-CoA kinase [Candidatus Aminicenantes bacterium]|nr:dephospho-CoA kinase [Candidatus Aminicenantes bacterium]
MNHFLLTVALTGGIATGKSIASKVFENLGCTVFYADREAHLLMEPEKPAWKKIVHHFGTSILNQDQTINRSKLGKIVFSDEKQRRFLNSVTHPLVNKRRLKLIDKLKQNPRNHIFISEAALTIEAGLADEFDKIIVVFCSPKIQTRRLMKRDGISEKEARNRIRSQMPHQEKKKYADYLIDTSGSISSTVEQAEKVYRFLIMDITSLSR